MEIIASIANKKIKLAASLKQKKHRDAEGLFLAEGVRLTEAAAEAHWPAVYGLCTDEAMAQDRVQAVLRELAKQNCPMYQVPKAIYDKVSDTQEPQGILLVLRKAPAALAALVEAEKPPFIIVLDQLQDPGNVGTIIRTADAAGCSAIVLTKNCADVYAAKTVRAAMGSLFHLPVVTDVSAPELLAFLAAQAIDLQVTALDAAAQAYFTADFTRPTAIAFGNEGNGISPELLAAASQRIFIPMAGQAESLNVATAAAVVIYEGLRQRSASQR